MAIMRDDLIHLAKDPISLALAGLGVSIAPHVFMGGMLLAMAGAAVAMRTDPEDDTRELWYIFLTAFLMAHIAAMVMQWAWAEFPPQLVMFGAGFASRRLVRFLMRLVNAFERRGDDIAGRIVDRVLPDKDGKSKREKEVDENGDQ